MRYVPASERALTMWPIEVATASGRPDPVGHVKWLRCLVTERGSASGKAGARSRLIWTAMTSGASMMTVAQIRLFWCSSVSSR